MNKYICTKEIVKNNYTSGCKKGTILIENNGALYHDNKYICDINSYLEENHCKPYKEENMNTETFSYESLPFVINFKVTDKNKNVTYQTVDTDDASYKIIINGTTTIVILKDGCKGISKCLPDDIYDREKGIDIAYRKALIKSYQKELKELTR